MSVILRPRSPAQTANGFSARPRQARDLAAVLTGGALVLALVLAAIIPASAARTAKPFLASARAASLSDQ